MAENSRVFLDDFNLNVSECKSPADIVYYYYLLFIVDWLSLRFLPRLDRGCIDNQSVGTGKHFGINMKPALALLVAESSPTQDLN